VSSEGPSREERTALGNEATKGWELLCRLVGETLTLNHILLVMVFTLEQMKFIQHKFKNFHLALITMDLPAAAQAQAEARLRELFLNYESLFKPEKCSYSCTSRTRIYVVL